MSDRWIEIIVSFSLAFIFIAITVALYLFVNRNRIREYGFRKAFFLDLFLLIVAFSAYFLLVDHFFPAHRILQSGFVTYPVLLIGSVLIRTVYPNYFKGWQER
jgi:hypothetical protein